jgi:hypothetical protein
MKRTVPVLAVAFLPFATLPRVAAAQGTATSSAEKISQGCAGDEYRQFDYWLGRWTVTDTGGKQIGTSHIIRVSDGCAVLEQWRDAAGNAGTSLNFYDKSARHWEQHWMGAGAGVLHLEGGVQEGAMTLVGKGVAQSGHVLNRLQWLPETGGKVRQIWSQSKDDGKTWQAVFNGLYSPVK